MTTPLVIHGHFYQPPRENPWTDFIDGEPSAAPFPDWNARVQAECYRPNAFARILNSYGNVVSIVNNYSNISFNFGPTLLSWMEHRDPVTYQRVLQADRDSRGRHGGHGNGLAQAYNHAILPLCNDRDRLTQLRWGVADFRHRFGREPEGLWMPETACNVATLRDLIDEGIRFTILSPYQAERVRPIGAGEEAWQRVGEGNIDPGRPYAFFHPDGSGRSMAVFFYDGPIARSVAFEGGLASSQALIERLLKSAHGEGRLLHVATDGESYGHHTKFGDRTLAHALESEAGKAGFALTNYGAFLERHPPQWEVQLKPGPNGEGTAWSCGHGVGRWYRDCGCQTGGEEGWNQAWRTPLREGFDFLRGEAVKAFEQMGREFFADPWAARDAYIQFLLEPRRDKAAFLDSLGAQRLPRQSQEQALTLLEMQRQAMLMYTSCGWFFSDISGIETVQVMKYAGRLMDDMADLGHPPPRSEFLEILAKAQSNVPSMGTGADVFRGFVDRSRVTPRSLAAHRVISSLVNGEDEQEFTAGYRVEVQEFQREGRDRLTLATCRVLLERLTTGRVSDLAIAAMHFGGIDFFCALKPFTNLSRFRASAARVWSSFAEATLPVILRMVSKEFGPEEYGLEHVLPGGRRRIANIVFGNLVQRFAEHYSQLYEDNRHTIEMLQKAGLEVPPLLRSTAEFAVGRRFEEEIRAQHASADPAAYERALEIAEAAAREGLRIDTATARELFGEMIAGAVERALPNDDPERWATALALVAAAKRLGQNPALDRAQELLHDGLVRGALPVTPVINELGLALGLAPNLLSTRVAETPTP
ncbi:MAG: DUF3536 domain-containing protein [Candidatus Lambdaproteobacteria bacterium]|nr:DUF3536 domain-containing protein [Candidatus Lambdaproteobacteria bacterium]